MTARTVKVVDQRGRDQGRFEIQSHTPEGALRPTVCVPAGCWPMPRAGLVSRWVRDPDMVPYPGQLHHWYIAA